MVLNVPVEVQCQYIRIDSKTMASGSGKFQVADSIVLTIPHILVNSRGIVVSLLRLLLL